ncbi:porin [Hymenobacter qilianensis]|nr:porin [Hymenobacter qilianensis]
MKFQLLLFGFLSLLPMKLVLAQTSVAAPDSAHSAPNPLTFYGFLDAYHGYDVPQPPTPDRPSFLYSHDRQNEFAVNNALLGVRYQNLRVRGAFGLHAGTYVAANYAAEDPVLKHIYEAYAGFRPFEHAWIDAGIFTSHLGFESAVSKDNWTLTRSLMAENSPYYEAGVRFTYEFAPQLTLTGLVLNGWQNIRENNRSKAFGTQVQWQINDKLLLNSSTFLGNEQPTDSVRRPRFFHDFYLRYTPISQVSLAVVFDVGKQEKAPQSTGYDTWHTAAILARYQFNDAWAMAARAEYYAAAHGVIIASIAPAPTDSDVLVAGGSLNLDYAPSPQVLVRLEGRTLQAADPTFLRSSKRLVSGYANLTSSIAISF